MTDEPKRERVGGRQKRAGYRRAPVNLHDSLWAELRAGGRTASQGIEEMWRENQLLRAALERVTAVLPPGEYREEGK